MLIDGKLPDDVILQTFNLSEKSSWKLKEVREELKNETDIEKYIQIISYRPFDNQYIFYHDALIERSRKEVMRHMINENIGIVTSRQTSSDFKHVSSHK